MNNTDTGFRIRERRRALDMTQEDLGKKIGVSKATINKYETGGTLNLRRPTIEKLADALCTSPEYLMGWTSNAVRVHTNNGIIGQNSGTIINKNSERTLSKEEIELLRIYNSLDVKGRIELLMTAMRLEEAQ